MTEIACCIRVGADGSDDVVQQDSMPNSEDDAVQKVGNRNPFSSSDFSGHSRLRYKRTFHS